MKISVIYFELFLLSIIFVCCLCAPTENVKDKLCWYNRNYELINRRISYFNLKPESLVRVKNVILFVGDGMGLTTVTASRVYKKQKLKNYEAKLVFDEFPASALIQTDTANSQISESAAAATALFCGVKTNFESLGVDSSAGKHACNNIESHTPSIVTWAQQQNLKTGFVTTARITHATPAALYAHSRRHMEDDTKTDTNCKDIARVLIEDMPGKNFNVIMGGGLRSFMPDTDPPGRRKDERNLTEEWLWNHPKGEYVTDRLELAGISRDAEHVLGIFASSHMHFNADRNQELEPSLAEMTATAIKILKRNNTKGFLLIVEAGKIDLAHHYNNAFRALDDTLALDDAVEVAIRSVDLLESLIIVTADHASGIVYSGFATPKDYSILGMDKFVSNIDNKPYQLLLYSSGLGFNYYNETSAKIDHRNSYHKAAIPSTWANHGGDDVPLYAVGALANILFGGTMDQTYIPHAIAFAMCLFDYKERCNSSPAVYKNEVPRIRKTNKIYLLKQKLQKDIFREKQNELSVVEESPANFDNNTETEVDLNSNVIDSSVNEQFNELEEASANSDIIPEATEYLNSDLFGNSTNLTSGKSRNFQRWGFLFLLISIVSCLVTT